MNQPLFKYTGSKRHIAKEIVSHFPEKFDTYYEPFLGGGSIFFEVLRQNRANRYVLSDTNEELIELFKMVHGIPKTLIDEYRINWNKFQELGQEYYYEIRDEFNYNDSSYLRPYLFHFLMRTCYNGTIRYNSRGEFNTSCHYSRPGMHPDKLEQIIMYYHELFKGKDITFLFSDFQDIKPKENETSVVYLDPPYVGKHTLYQESFNQKKFEKWLYTLKENKNCNYFFNLNGTDNEQNIDSKLFSHKILMKNGTSSYRRLKMKMVTVGEYFYIK